MKRVYQEGTSDCMRAAVASVLELALADVPFVNPDESPDNDWLIGEYLKFLEPRRLGLVAVDPADMACMNHRGYSIGIGKSPNGKYDHAVVCLDGPNIAHDPNPAAIGDVKVHTLIYFYALDPAHV